MIPTKTCTSESGDTLEAMDEEILQRDEEIRQMNAVLAQFKERRNDLLPLFRLPTEILTEILYRYLYSHLKKSSSRTAPALVTLLEVSRRVRGLTLGSRKLWSLIDFRSPESSKRMLSMADCVPLIIRVNGSVVGGLEDEGLLPRTKLLHSVLENVERLQELHMNVPREELAEFYATIDKSRPTTIPLTSLRIRCRYDPPPLPKCLANCRAPALSEVNISCGSLSLDSPLLGNALRYLEIGGSRHQGSFKTMLDGLRNLHNLHTLILRFYLPTSTQGLEAVRRVCLPRLAVFKLDDDITSCASLLEHVEIKYPTRVSMLCQSHPGQESLLHPFLASISRDGDQSWIRALSLISDVGRDAVIEAWPAEPPKNGDLFQSRREESIPLRILLIDCVDEDGGDEMARALCRGLRLENVHRLIVHNRDVFNRESRSFATWWRTFESSVHVTDLTLSGVDLHASIQALSTGVGVDGQFIMKELEILTVDCKHAAYETLSDKICNMLTNRRSHGLPLQKLELLNCAGNNEDDRLRLEELVPKLCWEADYIQGAGRGPMDFETMSDRSEW